jgi:hypothetical protein
MHIINTLKRKLKISSKQLLVAGAFTVALGAAVGLGLATKQSTSAASWTRDCTPNAIDNQNSNGGCGAASAAELVADTRTNSPNDLQAVYTKFGLPTSEYNRFASEARQGIAYKDGRIVVDGQTVATDAWSIGRSKKANSWNWNGYWADSAQNVFRGNEVPVMVFFNANGEMQSAIMNPCGNPTTGKIVKNTAECTSLTKSNVSGKKDTYSFKTAVNMVGNVSVAKVVYNFGDGTTETKTDLSPVEHTFTKSSTVTVSVTFKLPGGKTKVDGVKCKTQVTVAIPYYACTQLTPRALNDKKTQFRFTVKTSQGNGATLKDADFTLDGTNTTTGVTTKDEQGNIYKEYTFTEDGKSHKIVAKVNFNVAGGVQSKTCEAAVTSTKAPECPGKPGVPPESPECNPPAECKPDIPVGDARCEDTPQVLAAELPHTGIGNIFGLFAGTSAAGTVAHRVIASRRRRS